MCRTDERGSGILDYWHHQGENHAGTEKSNKFLGIVPNDHQGDRGRTKKLGDSRWFTCHCWGLVGTRLKRKEEWSWERKHAKNWSNNWQKNNMRTCKKVCTKESNNWRNNNTRMRERCNVRRVRVLVIFWKRMKSPKCINIDVKVSFRDVMWCDIMFYGLFLF